MAEFDYVYPNPGLSYVCGFMIGDGPCAGHRGVMFNTEFDLLRPIEIMSNKVAERLYIKRCLTCCDEDLKPFATI